MPADGAAARPRTSPGFAAVALGLAIGCHTTADVPAGPEHAVATGDSGSPAPATAVVAARCHASGAPIPIDETDAGELELGDVVPTVDAYAVGGVHRTAAGRVAAVMRIPRRVVDGQASDAASQAARWVDLAPTLGDAPPPRLVARAGAGGADLVAAAYLRGGGPGDHTAARQLALVALAPSAASSPPPFLVVPQQHDDSLGFDLAFVGSAGVVVWDEGAAPARGVIRALSLDANVAGAHDISPAESDAELPRIVVDGAGFVALWIARKAEPSRGDADAPEVPGEPRSFGWLESVRLDAHGAVLGRARSLTPASGHVSAYDVVALAAPERALLVVARDDGESVDGSGGALVRVRIVGDVPEPPVEYPSDGLGRGAPVLVEGPSSFLGWIGPGEQGRLLALDPSGAPLGPPSAEDALDDARPLRTLDAPASVSPAGRAVARLLVAVSSGAGAALRVLQCQR